MSDFEGEKIANRSGFDERVPNGDVEAVLVDIQRETDEIGLRVARRLAFDLTDNATADAKRLLEAARQAGDILSHHPPTYKEGEGDGFMARYVYAHPGKVHPLPPLVYPYDHFNYAEYVRGNIRTVLPVLVEHPTRSREGPLGYRLCAEADLGGRLTGYLSARFTLRACHMIKAWPNV
jgi:hypothetical protein